MDNKQNAIARNIDILEEAISDLHPSLLKLLIKDKTTRRNILWCTKDYESNGPGFSETDEIDIASITGLFRVVIQPRAAKAKEIQAMLPELHQIVKDCLKK